MKNQDWEAYALELGLRLRRARLAIGLSQERVASAAGISTFTYRKLEHGLSNPESPANPRLRTLVALSAILRVSVADLVGTDYPDITDGGPA